MNKSDFVLTFSKLKSLLKNYEKFLTVTADNTEAYNLKARYSEKYKLDVFFGAVQIKNNYVIFYLMLVFINPDLLNRITPSIIKRM